MKYKLSPYTIATMMGMALHASSTYASAYGDNLPEVQQVGDISYVTGGIGDEEREALLAAQHNYNLRILSAAGKSGAYPGDTHICIFDKSGNELLNTDADPIFYAFLPIGHYRVEETSEGQTKKQSFVIGANKPVLITFRWK